MQQGPRERIPAQMGRAAMLQEQLPATGQTSYAQGAPLPAGFGRGAAAGLRQPAGMQSQIRQPQSTLQQYGRG